MKSLIGLSLRLAKNLIYQKNLISYKLHGQKPWRRGYFEYKWKMIKKYINDHEIIQLFIKKDLLPANFGIGIDERVVEYPWMLSHINKEPAKLLDAGSALNFEAILSHEKIKNKKTTIVTLNPEANCFWHLGISYIFDDLRNLPFTSDYFDVITSISTIEHIGMDNTEIYTSNSKYKENKTEDYLIAINELKRVLKPNGKLLITVPFGKYHNFGFFQQFDKSMINKIISTFGTDKCQITFYKYTNNGWQICAEEPSSTAEYITSDRAKKDSSLPAAASAIACILITK